jgi:uncharacterized protein
VHPQRDALLRSCAALRGSGTNLVLRTNLTSLHQQRPLTDATLALLAAALDQVVVSVDGSEATHDARRGAGSYRSCIANLERYARIAGGTPHAAELSLACVMGAKDIEGAPGQDVRSLAQRLDVKRVRFRPLLPLGRAAGRDEPMICEGLMEHVPASEALKAPFLPLTSCGIGQNIFIRADGRAYPCYAWCGEGTYLGNVLGEGGMGAVLSGPSFVRLMSCTVDTIERCRSCDTRYLCGGACRAWGNQDAENVNAAPPQCDHLRRRAQAVIAAARAYLTEP